MKTELSNAQKAVLGQLSVPIPSELSANISQLWNSWNSQQCPPLHHKDLRKRLMSIVATAATGVIKLPSDTIGFVLTFLCDIYGTSAYRARQMPFEMPGGFKPLLSIAKKLDDRNARLAIDLLVHAGTVNKAKFGVTMRLEGGVDTLCSQLSGSAYSTPPSTPTFAATPRASLGPDGEGVLLASVLACLALCCETSEQNCRLVHKRGCTGAVVRALRTHVHCSEVVENCLVIMASLCEASSGTYTLAQHQVAITDALSAGKSPPKAPMGPLDLLDHDPALCTLLVHCVRAHEGSVGVATAALGLIQAMSLDTALARQLAMAGAFQCVWSACTRHSDRPALLSRALHALWRVSASAAGGKESRRRSSDAGRGAVLARPAWLRDGVGKVHVGGGHMLALTDTLPSIHATIGDEIDMGQPPCTITLWPLPKHYLSHHCAGLADAQAALPSWSGHTLPRPGWYPIPPSIQTLRWPPPVLTQAVTQYIAWKKQRVAAQDSQLQPQIAVLTSGRPVSPALRPGNVAGETAAAVAAVNASPKTAPAAQILPRSSSAAVVSPAGGVSCLDASVDELLVETQVGSPSPQQALAAGVGAKGKMARTPTPASIVARNTSSDIVSVVLQGRSPATGSGRGVASEATSGSLESFPGSAGGDRTESGMASPSSSPRTARSDRSIDGGFSGKLRAAAMLDGRRGTAGSSSNRSLPSGTAAEPFSAVVKGVPHRGGPSHLAQAMRSTGQGDGESALVKVQDKSSIDAAPPALKPWQKGKAAVSAARALSAPVPRAKHESLTSTSPSLSASSANSPREKPSKASLSSSTALSVPGASADACWELMRTWLHAPQWFPELQQVAALLPELAHFQDVYGVPGLSTVHSASLDAACIALRSVEAAVSAGTASGTVGFLPAAKIAATHAMPDTPVTDAVLAASHRLVEAVTSSSSGAYPWSFQQVMHRGIPLTLSGPSGEPTRTPRVWITPSGMATLRPFAVPPRSLPTAFHCGTPTASLGKPLILPQALSSKQDQQLQKGHTHALNRGYLLVPTSEAECSHGPRVDLLEPLLLVSPAYRAAVASRMQLKAIARLGVASGLLTDRSKHAEGTAAVGESAAPYQHVTVPLLYHRHLSAVSGGEGHMSIDTHASAVNDDVNDDAGQSSLFLRRNMFSNSEIAHGALPVPPRCIGTAYPLVKPDPCGPGSPVLMASPGPGVDINLSTKYDTATVASICQTGLADTTDPLSQRPLCGGEESDDEGQGEGGDADSDGSEEADAAALTASWETQVAERVDFLSRLSVSPSTASGVSRARLYAQAVRAMRAHAGVMKHVRAKVTGGRAADGIVAEANDEVCATMSSRRKRRRSSLKMTGTTGPSDAVSGMPSASFEQVEGSSAGRSLTSTARLLSAIPALQFESRFECGNLCSAVRTGPLEYELCLDPDTNTAGHTQWFFFRLQNIVAADGTLVTMERATSTGAGLSAVELTPHARKLFTSSAPTEVTGAVGAEVDAPAVAYTLHIVNLEKGGSSFNDGMRPWVYYDCLQGAAAATALASSAAPTLGDAADTAAAQSSSEDWKQGWPESASAAYGFGSVEDPLYIPPPGSPDCCHVPTLPGIGWRRSGVHVTYYRNSYARMKPKLIPPQVDADGYEASLGHIVQGNAGASSEEAPTPVPQYSQSWTISFPPGCHTAYFAYCLPYSYTDLRRDMVRWEDRASRVSPDQPPVPVHEPAPMHLVHGDVDGLGADALPVDSTGQAPGQPFQARLSADTGIAKPLGTLFTSSILHRSILCHSVCGNPVPLLTITDFSSGPLAVSMRPYIVLSARVHPGETNGSWMMRGLLDMLTSSCPLACELRRRVVFKVVPMLNPDGVLNGHHRTNAAGLDLNRHWSTPDLAKAPTIWHLRALIMALQTRAAAAAALSMQAEEKEKGERAVRTIPLETVPSASASAHVAQDAEPTTCPGIDASHVPYARAVATRMLGMGEDAGAHADGSMRDRVVLAPSAQPVLLFCDFHGHSKRRDVFTFGCNELCSEGVIPTPGEIPPSAAAAAVVGAAAGDEEGEVQEVTGKATKGVSTRLFPRLLSSRIDTFSMRGCAWKVSKAKLSCARVAMWRDALLNASYTIEATYGGSTAGVRAGAHMGAQAYEEVGYAFCAALLDLLEGPTGARAQETVRGLLAKSAGGGKAGKKDVGGK